MDFCIRIRWFSLVSNSAGRSNPDNVTIEFNTSALLSIKDDGVDTSQVKDDAITTAKIQDSNVTSDKINSGAVTIAKLSGEVLALMLG